MEIRTLLRDANFEIRQLRKQNELMRARLDMFDSVMMLLHSTPSHESRGMTEDVAWKIDKFLAENENNPEV